VTFESTFATVAAPRAAPTAKAKPAPEAPADGSFADVLSRSEMSPQTTVANTTQSKGAIAAAIVGEAAAQPLPTEELAAMPVAPQAFLGAPIQPAAPIQPTTQSLVVADPGAAATTPTPPKAEQPATGEPAPAIAPDSASTPALPNSSTLAKPQTDSAKPSLEALAPQLDGVAKNAAQPASAPTVKAHHPHTAPAEAPPSFADAMRAQEPSRAPPATTVPAANAGLPPTPQNDAAQTAPQQPSPENIHAGPEALALETSSAPAAPKESSQQLVQTGAMRATPAMAVAAMIARRFDGGSTSFELRLDPPELGRVDVKLTVDRDKKVHASIAAEHPQTLADLVRAAREIERALNESGLDLSENGLAFDLAGRDDRADGRADRHRESGTGSSGPPTEETEQRLAQPSWRRWGAANIDLTI
jgi:flagellar hook-length control protein FliK